ncbi:hypothetical protein Q9L58_004771 [Maublancomyces gigas]|uniref:UDENN FLCN/SMCR8-type domain-containing protein n=1 Tax=Discina gigas TaxID=1032678 RepID=A0ABR3GK66_9PEZI
MHDMQSFVRQLRHTCLQEKTSSNGTASSTVATRPVLRTKETILACTPSSSEDEEEAVENELPQSRGQRPTDDAHHLSSSPSAHSYLHSAPGSDDGAAQGSSSGANTHTHQLTYISTRAPSVPSRYSTLRQACVRTLSCELIPAQTGPIMFGDPLAGYTIAYVFRLPDPKARGGRRSYALVCICPDQKIVVSSWKYVVKAFESLVHRIKFLAAKKQTEDAQVSPLLNNSFSSIASRGPEGFLRRRPPGESGFGSQKGLAELVGREELFVEMHMCFVKLLGGLVRRFGCWAGSELGLRGGRGSGFATPALVRSRAGSVSSSVGADERTERKNGLGVSTPGTTTPNATPLGTFSTSEEMEAAENTQGENGVRYLVPAALAAGASLATGTEGLNVSETIAPRAAVPEATDPARAAV